MVSRDMEMSGGFELTDGRLVRVKGGGPSSVCVPVAMRLLRAGTDEVVNLGREFIRHVTFLLPKGVYSVLRDKESCGRAWMDLLANVRMSTKV